MHRRHGADGPRKANSRAWLSGIDLYSIVKDLVGTAGRNTPRAGPQNIAFLVALERDQGVARGPGGPPYFGAETAWKLDCK
jgi:hypothetical protein